MGEAWRRRMPVILLGGGVAFFAVLMVALVAASLGAPTVPTFAPTPVAPVRAGPGALPAARAADTVTLDARRRDAWRFFDFERGAVVAPPDTAGWDLAVRRHHLVAAVAAADLGAPPLGGLAGPAGVLQRAAFVPSTWGRDTANAALRRWYRYRMSAHLLEPNGHVFAVRTSAGRHALVEPLGYYCPGPIAGCLTFRYQYPVPPPAARAIFREWQ